MWHNIIRFQQRGKLKMGRKTVGPNESKFTGGFWGFFGMMILTSLLIGVGILLFGFGLLFTLPLAICMWKRWYAKHTFLNGQRLAFKGGAMSLLGRIILWALGFVLVFLLIGGLFYLLVVVIGGVDFEAIQGLIPDPESMEEFDMDALTELFTSAAMWMSLWLMVSVFILFAYEVMIILGLKRWEVKNTRIVPSGYIGGQPVFTQQTVQHVQPQPPIGY